MVRVQSNLFVAKGIRAETQAWAQFCDHSGGRGTADAIGDRGLANPRYSLVSQNFDEHRMQTIDANEINLGTGDFHAFNCAFVPHSTTAGRLEKRRPVCSPPRVFTITPAYPPRSSLATYACFCTPPHAAR